MIGIVAIGRNEGTRLERCLRSARRAGGPVVYVDSGSTDASVELARGLGVQVVHLDTTAGFTAARARNAGFDALTAGHPGLAYVQFVDGDCEFVDGWLETARRRLDEAPGLAVVAGRRRERHPDATPFNRLCDMEWNTPIGPAAAVGGDAMYRVEALRAVEGFDPRFICGEEPELCYRLRQAGWTVERIDADMTLHDADMTRWGQWWKRATRTGWAFTEGAATYGHTPERYNVKQSRSATIWAVLVPAGIVAMIALSLVLAWQGVPGWWVASVLAVVGVLLYPLMAWRIARYRVRTMGDPWEHAWLYGQLTMLGKWAEFAGKMRYWWQRWRGRPATIIEYKGDTVVVRDATAEDAVAEDAVAEDAVAEDAEAEGVTGRAPTHREDTR